ncbi:hypothetical protein [uncultured Schumannella sp.]|uniref:hypothetical protein n=1 Tax=uncultured Schumannella sp. TaxID=1195956 RepID=UPI002600EDFB|nr:hypothetical protein [uncultured Schumannella sp.]
MNARAAMSIVLAGVTAAVLAGCGFVTPIATQYQYDPSDGVSAEVGDVTVQNALVLTEDGTDGNLLLVAVNHGDDSVDLGVQYVVDGEKVNLTLELEGKSSTSFGFGDSGQLFLEGINSPAGSLLAIYFQYGNEVGSQIDVPVLDGSLEQYAPYLPTPTPTPTPTETATETDDVEPEPTETTAP